MALPKPFYLLDFIVFISGAVVMILELTGSRILAPYLGNSLPVWTGLIGIILGSLSIGYLLGGKLADQKPNPTMLGIILFLSGCTLCIIPLLSKVLLPLLFATDLDIRMQVSLAAIILFTLPSICLGMVSPYAIRLRLQNLATSGSTAGKLYALSTVGSIFGTFFAGFFLIAFLGSQTILYMLSGVMILLSLLLFGRMWWKSLFIFLFVVGVFYKIDSIYVNDSHTPLLDTDTAYNRVLIFESQEFNSSKIRRELLLGNVRNSAMYTNNEELVYLYTRYYRLVDHFVPEVKSALMIGGGAYSYPKDFIRTHHQATLDVVEIDPGLTEIAKEYFSFKPTVRTRVFHEDGRIFLNRQQKKYDAIINDAFSDYTHPFQLTTKEAVMRMSDLLNPQGVVITNTIASILGDSGKLLRAEYYTYKSVFPYVEVFPIQFPQNGISIQNIMIVASKNPLLFASEKPELRNYLATRWVGEIPHDVPLLTDNYAPIEYYALEIL